MIVTALEELGKGKKKVYLDGQFAFVLYKGELSSCHIEINQEIPEDIYEKIVGEILWRRVRQRCLYLLKSMDRTEGQMRQKLKQNLYPQELIDRAIEWLKSLHYLDDIRYAENYVRFHTRGKSRRQLFFDLSQKGISKEICEAAVEEWGEENEEDLIRKWVEKKKIDLSTATAKERQNLYAFLMRKGFQSSDVSKVIKGMEDFD